MKFKIFSRVVTLYLTLLQVFTAHTPVQYKGDVQTARLNAVVWVFGRNPSIICSSFWLNATCICMWMCLKAESRFNYYVFFPIIFRHFWLWLIETLDIFQGQNFIPQRKKIRYRAFKCIIANVLIIMFSKLWQFKK